MPASADVLVNNLGDTLSITASSAYSGKGLVLLWDDVDKGADAADWANSYSIPGVVSSSGSTFIVDLASLGVTNGAACRIAAATRYTVVDKVCNNKASAAIVNTGVKDTEIFGLIMSCYCTATDSAGSYIYTDASSAENTTETFRLSTVNSSKGYFRFYNRGSYNTSYNHETYYDEGTMHVFALTNGVLTVDGGRTRNSSGTATTVTYTDGVSFGNTGGTLVLGGGASSYNIGCWWAKVVFYGSDGGEIINYTPVVRESDGQPGFYDSVAGEFKTTAIAALMITNANAVAATPTGELIDTNFEMLNSFAANRRLVADVTRGSLSVTVPAGLAGEDIVLLYDDEDKSATGDWAHTNIVYSAVSAGTTYTVRLATCGVRNGQYAALAARHNLSLLDMARLDGGKNSRIDTGIKDTDLYGVRMGYYITWAYNSGNAALASYGTGFFRIGGFNNTKNYLRCYINGTHNESSRNRQLYLWTDGTNYSQINNVAATNGVFTLEGKLADYNGTARTTSKFTVGTAFGSSTNNVWMGWDGNPASYNCAQSGFWSYLQMDDKDGNLILDLIPATRNSDGTVGFYDRTRGSFVVPVGNTAATAGTVTDASYAPVNAVGAPFRVSGLPGLTIIVR